VGGQAEVLTGALLTAGFQPRICERCGYVAHLPHEES
jgi:hypothetical protein